MERAPRLIARVVVVALSLPLASRAAVVDGAPSVSSTTAVPSGRVLGDSVAAVVDGAPSVSSTTAVSSGRVLVDSVAAVVDGAPSVSSTTAVSSGRVLVDSVAAVVDRRVFTWGEIAKEARILLVNKVGARAVHAGLDTAFLDSVLDFVIVQELLLREARRRGFAPREQEVDKGVALFKLRFDDEEAYLSFLSSSGVDEETVRGVVRRDQTVDQFLQATVEEGGQPTDEMVAHLVDKRGPRDPTQDDAARARAARATISSMSREERLTLLVDALKSTVEVRLVERHRVEAPVEPRAESALPATPSE